jgi:ABC-type bacteriocin/lantibiotic exporter with double-glycine peptidase domain
MKIRSKDVVLQRDYSDCGVACLATLIKFYQGDCRLEKLRELSGTSKQGTTLLGLMQAAKQVGFNAEGLEAESLTNLSELTHPAILHVTIDDKLQHYIIYFPSKYKFEHSENLLVFDPAKGIKEISKDELDKLWKSKRLLKLIPNERFERKAQIRSKKIEWINSLIREDYRIFLITLFLGVIISVLGIATAIFTQILIDDILPREDTQKLIASLVLVAILLLTRSGLIYLRGFFMIKQGMDFNNRILQKFYNNLLNLPKLFFDTRRTGDLIARMNDTRRIQSVLSIASGVMVIDVLLIVVSMVIVFTYSQIIGFIILSVLPIYLCILIWFNKPVVSKQREVMNGYAMAESNFVDTIQGVSEIKLMSKQFFFEKLNATIYSRFQQKIAELSLLNIKFSWVSEITSIICLLIVFGVSSWLVLSGKLRLGEIVALLTLTGNLMPAVNRLVIANIQIQEALVAFDRMFEFTSMEKEATATTTPALDLSDIFSLELESVSFRFPGRKQILNNVSFNVNKGEMIALLGESGGGKSTTLQLIQKFYSLEQGAVLVNGRNLNDINHQVWRSKLGCVPQDVKIFNGSLIYNITLSDQKEDFQCAISFCEEMGFGKFFNELPQSYLTLVGEEGINLSGGQKQLVALARVLYRKPKLLLLDEATSAMDKNTEGFILSLLFHLKPEMAILMVTHRTQIADMCDRVYILENGTISAKK